jgi:magnesium transporter
MSRLIKNKIVKKIGLSPGTLIHIGEKKVERAKITLIDYSSDRVEEKEVSRIEETFPYKDRSTVTWINIDGLHDTEIIEKIGKHFNVHPLILEDILHTNQRPKIEDFDDYLFVVLQMLSFDQTNGEIKAEQVSIILGANFVISFQEREGDVFNQIRTRIKSGKGRIRRMGSDYQAYALIDAVVDHYFLVLEKLGEKIEYLEEELVAKPTTETLHTLHSLKREMVFLRRSVWPLREVASQLERGESHLIKEDTRVFLRDLYDHTIQVIDTIETFRDMVSGMLDLYLSSISNKMNDVMKVLTIIATIFIPITFIAGIYGMNFEFMPELKWHWGYPLVWLLMVVIAILMILYFRVKKWL